MLLEPSLSEHMADSNIHQTTKIPDSILVRSPQQGKSKGAPTPLEFQPPASAVLQRLALNPGSLTPTNVISLQHQLGNRATLPFIQAAQLASNPTIPVSQSSVR